MSKPLRPALATLMSVLATGLVATTMLACGGSSSSHAIPANSVALVGETPITKATLNHWMNSIAGGDFWERFSRRAPLGLVSEPANYPACESAARTLIAANPHKPSFTAAQISQKCHQLTQAIREQSLLFLISVLWRVNEGKEKGIAVSDREAQKYTREYNAVHFPKPGQFEAYLADHEWVASDVDYQVKRNLLTRRLREKVSGESFKLEETQHTRNVFMSYVEHNIPKRKAETRCRPAYAVSSCRGYTEPASLPPAPITILEELTGD